MPTNPLFTLDELFRHDADGIHIDTLGCSIVRTQVEIASRPYMIVQSPKAGDRTFLKREITDTEQVEVPEGETFVVDLKDLASGRPLHVACRVEGGDWDVGMFMGTETGMVFAIGERGEVIPAPREQWFGVDRSRPMWWGHGLYNDEHTDFFMHGLYGLPTTYSLLSRNDYESRLGLKREAIIAELTALGYEHVGRILEDDRGFEPV